MLQKIKINNLYILLKKYLKSIINSRQLGILNNPLSIVTVQFEFIYLKKINLFYKRKPKITLNLVSK